MMPSEMVKKKYKCTNYYVFTLSFFILPYRFTGFRHSAIKRFMHVRQPLRFYLLNFHWAMYLFLVSDILTLAETALLGANSL